jgi:hypothetical protein
MMFAIATGTATTVTWGPLLINIGKATLKMLPTIIRVYKNKKDK